MIRSEVQTIILEENVAPNHSASVPTKVGFKLNHSLQYEQNNRDGSLVGSYPRRKLCTCGPISCARVSRNRWPQSTSVRCALGIMAAGGMADARSLVAAIAMGAEGINMGTRFIATQEAPVHQNVKDAILKARELDTRLVMRPLRNTERVLNNVAVEKIIQKEETLGKNITFDDIASEVSGVYPRVMLDGEMDVGAWSCGMVAGLINDIPSCKDLIERTMLEADALIQKRLMSMLY